MLSIQKRDAIKTKQTKQTEYVGFISAGRTDRLFSVSNEFPFGMSEKIQTLTELNIFVFSFLVKEKVFLCVFFFAVSGIEIRKVN